MVQHLLVYRGNDVTPYLSMYSGPGESNGMPLMFEEDTGKANMQPQAVRDPTILYKDVLNFVLRMYSSYT